VQDTDRESAELVARRLAAIVDASDDAIVSKDLNGIVQSWNRSAERMFGYTPEEMIGQSIRTIIPADRQSEEDEVIEKLRRGETIDHF
jgi:two-component system, chemotaxis family, CheB/CheR fusion protein